MSIKEKYEKYTTEELEEAAKSLREKISYNRFCMEKFAREKDVELYETAKSNYDFNIDILMDVELAIKSR